MSERVSPARIAELAALLDDALQHGTPIDPLTELCPELGVDDAYAVQMAGVRAALERGAVISGKKIGLTSNAMQESLGVGEPDYGHLYDSMFCPNGDVPTARLLQPRAEAEIAFVLKDDLKGPGVTTAQVLAATDFVAAAIEIVDSRVRDWKIKLADTVSDNASSGYYVLGELRIPVGELELPAVRMVLRKNGEEVGRGDGTAVLGDPAHCVAWLANKMGEYGVTLRRGEVILSGALSAAVPACRGDRFTAEFSGLGSVSANFV